MKVALTREPIPFESVVDQVRSPSCGAVVLFLGTVREMSDGRSVDSLEYEAHEPMAERQLIEVLTEAEARWPLAESAVVHRLGHLELGDIAVAVATASPHRAEAFEAARWIMDTIKQRVPIWKRENWADGSSDWVHPVSTS